MTNHSNNDNLHTNTKRRIISYRPLFITLAEKGLSLNHLSQTGVVSTATQAKFKKNASVSLTIIMQVCTALDVPIEKVVEAVEFTRKGGA